MCCAPISVSVLIDMSSQVALMPASLKTSALAQRLGYFFQSSSDFQMSPHCQDDDTATVKSFGRKCRATVP
jgi:hypothetical protein